MNRYPYSAFAGELPTACLTSAAYDGAKKTALAKAAIGGAIFGAIGGAVMGAAWTDEEKKTVVAAGLGALLGAMMLGGGAVVAFRTLETAGKA